MQEYRVPHKSNLFIFMKTFGMPRKFIYSFIIVHYYKPYKQLEIDHQLIRTEE